MYHTQDVQLQIGGSDQFGNIITGIESIKHMAKIYQGQSHRSDSDNTQHTPFGFTVPLLTTASGEKFGKSAGNAIWLDKSMTRVFDLYGVRCFMFIRGGSMLMSTQFFVRTADADVNRYLKFFTLLPLNKIEEAMAEHEKDASKRIPHHLLAKEFVALVHGEEEAAQAEAEHRAVFQQKSATFAVPTNEETEPKTLPSGANEPVPDTTLGQSIVLPASIALKAPLPRLLHFAGLVESRSQGIRLIRSKGAYIGRKGKSDSGASILQWVPITDVYKTTAKQFLINHKYVFVRAGKWNVRTITIVSDEEFAQLGLPFPEHFRS